MGVEYSNNWIMIEFFAEIYQLFWDNNIIMEKL